MDDLTKRYLFLTVLEARNLRSGSQHVQAVGRPSSWLADGHSHIVDKGREVAGSLLIKTLIPSWNPTLMTSAKPSYLPNVPLPDASILEFQHMNFRLKICDKIFCIWMLVG